MIEAIRKVIIELKNLERYIEDAKEEIKKEQEKLNIKNNESHK